MIDAYRQRKWVPVPLVGKKPLEAGYLSLTTESPWPAGEYNVGLLLGPPSAGLLDVDLDCPEAVALAAAFLPPTLTFCRGPLPGSTILDSAHRFYSCPEIDKRETYSTPDTGMIVEIRSGGGQTMVPPSVHPDTHRALEWAHPWMEPTVVNADDLRRRVGWLAGLSLVARHWPKGGRHEAQLALAGCLLGEGWDETTALEALCAVCRIAGDEDRAKREATIRRTAERVEACEEIVGWGSLAASLPPEVAKVARGWLGQRRAETIDRERLKGLAETMTRSGNEERKHLGRLLQRVVRGELVGDDLTPVARAVGTAYPEADVGVLERTFAMSTPTSMRGAIERGQQEALSRDAIALTRGDHTDLAKRVKAVLARTGELAFDDGDVWRCEGIDWRPVTDAEIDLTTMSFSGAPVRGGGSMEINSKEITAVRKTLLPSLCARPGWFAAAPPGVAFQGTFVGCDGPVPLTPEHRCRAVYPWRWDPEAACPAWLGFLAETYGPERADVAPFLAEFAGACLLGAAPMFQKAVVLFGDGGTGKSQVVRVLIGIMPDGTVSSVPPQEWAKEFSRARLVGMRLNAVSEMPSSDILDSESFKAIVSGDPIQACRKFKDPFDFCNRAGVLAAANLLPYVRDQSSGFWRRIVTIDHDIVPETNVPGIAELLLEAEREGIVAWALRAGLGAIKRGAYSLPRDTSTEQWRMDSDTVASWLRDRCVIGGGPTSSADMYDDYRRCVIDGGQKPVSLVAFSRRLGRIASAHLSAHRRGELHTIPLAAVNMGPKEGRIRGWNASILNTR